MEISSTPKKKLIRKPKQFAEQKFSNFEEYLSLRMKELIIKNDKECIIDAQNKEPTLITKIQNHLDEKCTDEEKSMISVEDILEKIKTDTLVRSLFRKDTTRQNIYELCQIEWIKIKKFSDVVKLPAVKGGLYLEGGQIKKMKNSRGPNATKTIDVYSKSSNMYGILKYTKTEGGSQDNQYADVKKFITEITTYLDTNLETLDVFHFYLDGPYYTQSRISELLSMIPDRYKDKMIITSASNLNEVNVE
jgi:hypothetical protein